jgi:hypothetical protein
MYPSHFSVKRIFSLIRLDLFNEGNNKLTLLIALFFILFFGFLIPAGFSYQGRFIAGWVAHIVLQIVGCVLAANAFKKSWNLRSYGLYAQIPAVPIEKFLSRFLQTGLLFAIAAALIYLTATMLANASEYLLFGGPAKLRHPPPYNMGYISFRNYFHTFLFYFLLHALFFAGGLFFKRNAFIITLGIVLGIFLFIAIIAANFFHADVAVGGSGIGFPGVNEGSPISAATARNAEYLIRILSYFVVMPLCWIGAYLLYRKKEV